ncbi:hypothetical protein MSAR_42430 [Mycolicibacterium sarraceniae]|uniref:Uncharacterized protein n=1 Tax=Mycolicibacterium sarraceniae TaxID=1534348 RepID=A0A7I7SVS3_9MYCO|nr:hypothetical protein MSAR_42430 [Mycolicibacterium sarraceniae]
MTLGRAQPHDRGPRDVQACQDETQNDTPFPRVRYGQVWRHHADMYPSLNINVCAMDSVQSVVIEVFPADLPDA